MVDASKAVCLLPSTQDPPSQDPLLWLSLPGLHGNRPLLNDLNTLAHTRIPTGFSADSRYQICTTITLPRSELHVNTRRVRAAAHSPRSLVKWKNLDG